MEKKGYNNTPNKKENNKLRVTVNAISIIAFTVVDLKRASWNIVTYCFIGKTKLKFESNTMM